MKSQACSECKAMDSEIADQDLIDYIALIASKTGTKVEVVSGKTEHGVMLGSLGKIAAILRYNPNRN
jgi:peptide chain release factor subunit 1